MLKIIPLALALLISPLFGEEKESLKPMVGTAFGKVMVLEVQFVDKENTYYQQNIVKEPWLAKVISINGVELKDPVIIEYVIAQEKDKEYVKQKKYEFLAYESIYTLGTPDKWTEEVMQIPYMIRQRLVMQEMTRKIEDRLDGKK